MAYCTIADVQTSAGGESRLRELSDVDKASAVNRAAVESAIVEADADINSYVHKRFGVDLADPVPPLIRSLSSSMAVFVLKRRRNMLSESDMQIQETRLAQLKAIATGELSLGVSPVPAKSEYVGDQSTARSGKKEASRQKLRGFW